MCILVLVILPSLTSPLHPRKACSVNPFKMEGYACSAPVDCTKEFSSDNLKGKTAIVTGGKQNLLRLRKIVTDNNLQERMESARLMPEHSQPWGMKPRRPKINKLLTMLE